VNVVRGRRDREGIVVSMTAFVFTCDRCGPIKVIPMEDIRKRRASPPSHWCPHCGEPVSAAVVHDLAMPDAA
jgi:predicted RNA-binding Zn-ribbon protein involved in translation (DUF1610 family)